VDYRTIPPLAAYIDRVGAEQLNFRRFLIKDVKGDSHYYTERCVIKIEPDGKISCSDKNYAPNEDEAEAIRFALASASFPRAIAATPANLRTLEQKVPEDSGLFEFWDRDTDSVIMVQERAVIQGRKAYIPWTFWSDGEWRRMEPDRSLPFWKPRKRSNKSRIMIHEGAKTARFVERLLASDDPHPWKNELADYEHWGMIGGALAPHRSDYAELIKMNPSEVVYVCDNDAPGKAALQLVSRCYGRSLKGIMFDDRWPPSWDLADPMPKSFYAKGGRYVGPDITKLLRPATWATEQLPIQGKGRPGYKLTSDFSEEWMHCTIPEVYVHRDWPWMIYSLPEFNNWVRPFSDVDNTARYLQMRAESKSAKLQYNPAIPSGLYVDDSSGDRYINTHMPSSVRSETGDCGPWFDFLEHFIPNKKDREHLMRWVATLIAAPKVKMMYGLLLVSETQGIGKGTLGEKILAPLVGENNVSYPSESEIVESNYNYWAVQKRLAVVHEIYAGHSSKAYNKLKSIITDRNITVSKKYQPVYDIENWVHVFACSNSKRALQLSTDDRRWFVPGLTEERRDAEYWIKFNAWLTESGGLQAIRGWAEQYIEDHGPVSSGMTAPESTAKSELIKEGFSPGMALVAQVLEGLREEFGEDEGFFLLDTDLVKLIKDQLYEGRQNDRIERAMTLRKMAKSFGWIASKEVVRVTSWGLRLASARTLSLNPKFSTMSDYQLINGGHKPFDVVSWAQKKGAL
jgi:hypothetical protein